MPVKEGVTLNTDLCLKFVNNIDGISEVDWNMLNSANCPFLRYDFFKTLENSQSVSAGQGWQPHHLVATTQDEVTAIIPMYLKSHSWGEYVFDWDWAQAFERNGIDYYPKLVATIPFTPVTSDKLLSSKHQMTELFEPLIGFCQQENIHSWHILYCHEIKDNLPEDVYQRNTVQFHWFNRNYKTFDDFLNTFTSRKRKNTRKERRSIIDQGVQIRQLKSADITQQDIEFFYLTYQLTYLKKGHQPHLSPDFFNDLLSGKFDNVLLIIASHTYNDTLEDIACALFFYDETQLYGRYWGCTTEVNNLHFELCYYQGIEFCIDNKIQVFNPGTQGEHKIQRGFEPVLTYSYHWIKHQAFKEAVKHFCQQEQAHMLRYQQQCRERLPFAR